MVTRSGRQLAEVQSPQLMAERKLGNPDPVLFAEPLPQVGQAPADHSVDGRDRARLSHFTQVLTTLIAQDRRLAERLAIREPIGPMGIEAQRPFTHGLQANPTDLGRLGARASLAGRR